MFGDILVGSVIMSDDGALGRVRSSALLRPGELIFDCNFESGNLGHVEAINECEYDLSIRPDTNNSSVCNVKAGQKVVLNIINFCKTKSLYREGLYCTCDDGTQKKHMVFFSSRVHPGETPASYVVHGIIDFLISSDPAAQILRDNIIFKIVPMLNPDGVFLGNYRCSYMGFDLNRHWQCPSMWSQPSIASTKRMLLEYATSPQTKLDFYIDIHAHTTMMNGFMYGNVREDEEHHEREQALPRLLDTISRDFAYRSTVFNRDPVKAGSARRSMDELLAPLGAHSYTLEVSFYCARDDLRCMSAPFTPESYMELGRNVCEAIMEWYKLPNPRRRRAGSQTTTATSAFPPL